MQQIKLFLLLIFFFPLNMLSSLPNEILINIFKYLTTEEIFDLEKIYNVEFRLNEYFWEPRCPIPKSKYCKLSYYDIVKKFNKGKICFSCDKNIIFEYIFLINQGYQDDGYYLECYHKECISKIQKMSSKLGLYRSPISEEKLMGIETNIEATP